MREARFKLAVGSVAALVVAGVMGVGLANYAESGSFDFYTKPRAVASMPESADGAAPATDTVYAPSYSSYSPAPPSRIDALYPANPYVPPDPRPIVEVARQDSLGVDPADWKREPSSAAVEGRPVHGGMRAGRNDSRDSDRTMSADDGDDVDDAMDAPDPDGDGE